MCKETSINQDNSLKHVDQFLRTLIIIYRSLGQAREALAVAEIASEITDLMSDKHVGDKKRNGCEIHLYLAQLLQQNASNSVFDADKEMYLAEHYYLHNRDRKENIKLRKNLSYANFLCERRHFTDAVAVLEDIRNQGRKMWNEWVYADYISCAFYGAGVQKSVHIDGELFTTVEDVLYNLMVRVYVGMGKKKEAVATCETYTDVNWPDVHEAVFGMRPSCKPYTL